MDLQFAIYNLTREIPEGFSTPRSVERRSPASRLHVVVRDAPSGVAGSIVIEILVGQPIHDVVDAKLVRLIRLIDRPQAGS